MSRTSTHVYQDPLDLIWIAALRRVGFRLERSADCFASVDPAGVLILGTDDTLDADDCLAQMIFHELCHSLVQGPAGLRERDWGLDNLSDQDTEREHATLRVQASLAEEYGLRRVLGPTTDFRGFYDALPSDPLEGANKAERAWALAGLARVTAAPWSPHLREALSATQRVVAAAAPFASADALYALYDPTPRESG